MKKSRTFLSRFILILTTVVISGSCKKESTDNAPVVPPSATMSIDFSFLSSKKAAAFNLSNWQFTEVSLAFWNTLLNKNCDVPLAAFENVLSQNASYIDNSTWEWKSKLKTDSIQIISELQGKFVSDSVEWKLNIATNNSGITSSEFLWIEGASASDQSGGWWLIYDHPSRPVPFMKIYWVKNNENQISVQCTYVNPNDGDAGFQLEYGSFSTGLYTDFYKIDLHDQKSIYIELNKTTNEGHILSEFMFNDKIWHCWNSLHENVNCN